MSTPRRGRWDRRRRRDDDEGAETDVTEATPVLGAMVPGLLHGVGNVRLLRRLLPPFPVRVCGC